VINRFATSRQLWWGIPLLLIVLWVAGSLLPATEIGIPQAPVATWLSLPIVRFARDIAASITLGCVIVGGLVVPQRSMRALRWASVWAILWLVILIVQFILTISDVLAVPIVGALDPTTMWSVLTQVDLGRVFMWQFIGVLVVVALSQAVFSRVTAWVVVLITTAASLAPSFLGHGGLTGGHAIATISLGIHLVSVAVWLGGLAAVVALLAIEPKRAQLTLPRFSAVALAAAIVAAESGLLNSSVRLTQPMLFLTTWYGALVIAKVIFIGWLGYFGLQQRRRVIPNLDADGALSTARLFRYASTEFLIMGFAVGVAISMSRIGPVATPNANGATNLITISLLLLGVPQCAVLITDRIAPTRFGTIRRYPETMAVVASVVCIELFGLNLIERLVGVQLAALFNIGLVLLTGWLLAVSLTGERQRSGVVTAMVMWVITCGAVAYFQTTRPQNVVDTRAVAAATVTGLVILALYLVKPLLATKQLPSPLLEPSASPTQ